MAYYLRTNNGIMIAKVDDVVAGCMMRQGKGEWKQKAYVNNTKKTVYVFSDDFTYGDEIMKLCIWEGFYLDKVN